MSRKFIGNIIKYTTGMLVDYLIIACNCIEKSSFFNEVEISG